MPAAWSAVGGKSKAGAGIKIGIIDSGIDQNHPGISGSVAHGARRVSRRASTAYTNNKVIVARSYVQQDLAPGYAFDPAQPDPATTRSPTITRRATAWATARRSR